MNKRIVVTGIGVISSIGIGRENFWQALMEGKSGISEITSFDTSEYPTHRGGEIKNFRKEDFLPPEKIKHLGRASCLAIAAAKLALEDSGLSADTLDKEKTGVVLGTTMGESQILEKADEAWVKNGIEAIDPAWILPMPANNLSCGISKFFGLSGPNYIIPNACAAGNYAIGYACDLLKQGKVELMFAGGADAFSRIAFTGFNRMLAVAPEKCQPFDKNRKGMMVGEGAGIIVLEPQEFALKRKARIYAEILGYGVSCDAHHMTAPFSEGISRAIENALKITAVKPEEVSYINAHGTGTPANDREECLAIKKVFGDYAKKVPVSSTKSMLGHTMGAASALEAIACCLAVQNDSLPPTINFQTPDPECEIDCIPNTSRKAKVEIAMNNASAFGGNNASLILRKFPQ